MQNVTPEQQPDVAEPRARRYAGKTLEERRGDQRERLIAAARDVFARGGYTAAGIDEIVSAARVSRTSFYAFFANKEECLLAVVQAGTERIGEALMEVIAKPLEPAERIRAEITVLAEAFAADPAMARVILIEAVGATPAVERVRAQARQAAADLIEAQLREYPGVARAPRGACGRRADDDGGDSRIAQPPDRHRQDRPVAFDHRARLCLRGPRARRRRRAFELLRSAKSRRGNRQGVLVRSGTLMADAWVF